MKTTMRRLSWLLLITIVFALLVPISALGEEIELRFMWWGGDARHKATLAAIDRYMELNPNVKISAEYSGYDGYYQNLATQLAAKAAPDLIQMDTPWFYDLMRQGDLFVDLYGVDTIDKAAFDESTLGTCLRNGQLVGLPTGVTVEQWFIANGDLLDRHGIPRDVKLDWDTLIEYGKKVHEESPDEYLLNAGETTLVPLLKLYIAQRTGESIVTDDYELMIDEAILTDAFTYLKRLYDEGVLVPFEESVTTPILSESVNWLSGKTGMIYDASSIVTSVLSTVDFDVTQICVPILEGCENTGVEIRPSQIMSINANSAHVEETAKFLNWFMTDMEAAEILKDVRGLPATGAARQLLLDKNIYEPLINEINEAAIAVGGKEPSNLSFNAELTKIFQDSIAKVAYGMLSPADAATDMISQFEAKLAELKP